MSNPFDDVPSPCIKVCAIDADLGICRGCLRTLNEITVWSTLSPGSKRAVLARLDQRRQELPHDFFRFGT